MDPETPHQCKALRESEEKYRPLLESIDQGFCTIEVLFDENQKPVDYRFLMVNPAFERQTGIQNGAGRRMREIAPLHEERWLQIYGQIALTGEPMRFENTTQLHGNFDVSAWRIGAPAERKVAILFNDITARTQADTALRETERFVSSVAAASPHLTYVFDLERMGVTYVSRPFLGELGYPKEMAERVTGLEAFRDYMEPEEMPHLSRLLDEWRTLPEGHLRQDEYRLRHADGTIRSFAGRELAFARRPDGSVRQIIGSLVDITERKQAEEALREARDSLEQRVQERTAELSHALEKLSVQAEQLRSLASELTLVEQRERVRLATQIHDGLQQLLVAAKLRVVDMVGRAEDAAVRQDGQEISSLLAEALADARSLTAELSPPVLRTGGLRAGLEWLARWSQEKHHLTVQVTAPALPLPTLPEDLTVLLFQAVRELLFNVVKYAQVPAVVVTLEWDAPSLTLTVTDAGIGFDPRGLRGEGGSGGGYGLASIRHRLELLGGCMTISSAPGQGTQITLAVLLPMGGQPAATPTLPSPTASPQTALAPAPGSPRTIRILLVDDHEVVRQALAQLLRATPDLAVVGEAGTGTAAVALARHLVPEVVLMDINLPEMNGIEATRLIHAEFPSIRVIGLSMFDRGDQQAAMQAAGAVAYVSKSAPPDALLAAIRGRTGGAGGEDVSARG